MNQKKRTSHTVCQFHSKICILWTKSKKCIRVFLLRNIPFPQKSHAKALGIEPIFRVNKPCNKRVYTNYNIHKHLENFLLYGREFYFMVRSKSPTRYTACKNRRLSFWTHSNAFSLDAILFLVYIYHQKSMRIN